MGRDLVSSGVQLSASVGPPRPIVACPKCGRKCGVIQADAGTRYARFLLVDYDQVGSPRARWKKGETLVWVELHSGYPPRGTVLPIGALHQIHRCPGKRRATVHREALEGGPPQWIVLPTE